MPRIIDTKLKILKEGRSLLQIHGYNGFSFQDIANTIGIKKPSLYDHYGSKDELIIAILKDYERLFEDWKIQVHKLSPIEKIKGVFSVFYSFSCDRKKVCPVLALITDLNAVSKPVQNEMKKFMDNWLQWVNQVIKDGQKQKIFKADINSRQLSELLYSQIMGSQIQAKIKNHPDLILESSELLISLITKK